MTRVLPLTSASETEDHWPCRMDSPGTLLVHWTLPSFLLMQMMAGALGAGTFLWVSSTPLPVMMYIRSPEISGEEEVMLWGKTPSLDIMSRFQTSLGSPW